MANLIVSDRTAQAIRAAVYARFSTDRQSEESIADQVRVCSEFAELAGWAVTGKFTDEGISGAAVGNRPGLGTMLEKCQAGEFDVLLVMDLSRLSRSQADLPKTIDRLAHRGVRVVGVQDGYDSTRKGHKLQAGLSGIMGEAFREMVSDRTYTALESRAKDARPTGGRAYGYTVRDGARVIDEDQAAIAREIFTRYAAGESQKAIAADLNKRDIPSPGSNWHRSERRTDGRWLVSALHAILHNEIYVGRLIWNRREFRKDPDTGKRLAVERPRSEWIVSEQPDLALVDVETWQKVRARDSTGYGSPNARPRYLLSGILLCGDCGRAMTLVGGKGQRYVCATNHAGGDAACGNRLGVSRLLAEEMVLMPVQDRLLSVEAVKRTVDELREIAAGRRPHNRPQAKADPRIAELRRLVRVGTLSEEEARPALERLEAAQTKAPTLDVDRLVRTIEERAKTLRAAIQGKAVAVARDALRRLIGSVRCVPTPAKGGAFLTAYFDSDSQSLPLLEWLRTGDSDWESALVAGAGFDRGLLKPVKLVGYRKRPKTASKP